MENQRKAVEVKFDAIVPCFNEEGRVGEVLTTLSTSAYIDQVIFVNDGSTDNSLSEAKKIKRIKIVPLKKNVGKGDAVKRAMQYVKTPAVFLFDADLLGLSEKHIKKMYTVYCKNPESMVVGLRQKSSLSFVHWLRKNILPLIAGERVLATANLKEILKSFNTAKYGLEPYMNHYFHLQNKQIHITLLRGLNDLPKWKKESYGFKPFFQEGVDIFSKYLQIYSKEVPKNIFYSLTSFILPMETEKKQVDSLYAKTYPQYKTTIDGVSIHYAKAGSGPVLVFVHGWANNWISWIPLANYLYKDYTLYLIDLPGFGDSGDLPYYSIELAAKYLEKFVLKLPQKPKALIGLSMGSMVVAETGRNNSNISEAIVLIGAVIKHRNVKSFISKTLRISLKIIGYSKLSEAFLKKIIETRIAAYSMSKYINMYKFNKFLVDEYGMIGKKKMRQEAFTQMGHSGASYDLKHVLTKYYMPTFLIYGREDKISSQKDAAKYFLKINSQIKLQAIPFAGHVVALEQPEKVAINIKNYLDTLTKTAKQSSYS